MNGRPTDSKPPTSRLLRIGALLGALMATGAAVGASKLLVPGPQSDRTGVTPEGWRLTPAGDQIPVGPGPLAVAITPDGELVLVEDAGYDHHALLVLDARTGAIVQTFAGESDGSRGYYVGLVVSRDGSKAYASDGAGSAVRVFDIHRGRLAERPELPLPAGTWPAGMTLSGDGSRLYVTGNLTDTLLQIDLATSSVVSNVPVGHRPYGVASSRDGRRAYVSNWGASTVTVVDTSSSRVVDTIAVGTHPSAVAHHPTDDELYVADTDSDNISVIDTERSTLRRTISLRPFAGAPVGLSPNALAVDRKGRTLYVANAGQNAIAVIRLADRPGARDVVAGLIPTGWYPSAVALDPAGQTLFVANMKGLGIGPVAPDQYIADMLRGSISRIPVPLDRRLAEYTQQVWQNVVLPQDRSGGTEKAKSTIVPDHVGQRSPIEHVIYVMKENRTYDQVLGDLGRGNGNPELAIFGESVTPNQHALARRFVTFDNFYCDGEVSADGWTWSNGANANTYNQKNWPLDYGFSGRLYDFGGFGDPETAAFPGEDTIHSWLWDRLADKGIAYRNYGFFVNGAPVVVDDSMPGLEGYTDLAYHGWNMDVADQERIDEWLREFRGFETSGQLPTVEFVYLPRDHTVGTYPGAPTPRAMVADNDLALGRLVEAVSHSRFWSSTAIFVVEDDAQDGPDHVDGHRTVALVVSPYTQTGEVDSTFYSTVSMLRTMELILGVEPMTQFDALATPMNAAFASRPDLRRYRALVPDVSLAEVSPPDAPLAQASAALDFTSPDAANHRVLNDAIWQSVRGSPR